MAGASLLAQSVAKLYEAEAGGQRFVDMCISLRVHETGEELIRVGGRWDRRKKRYCGEAKRVRVLRVHRGQVRAARWFAEWLKRRATGDWEGFRRVWSAMFVGGRRGGKSKFAVWAVAMFVLTISGSQAWAISPTQEETDELERAIRDTLPSHWYKFRGDPRWEFKLANGSVIRLLSGHKPSSLKRGRVDFALYNEGQLMTKQGYVQLRGATADSGGLTIIAANPPDLPIGRWIEELYEKARASIANDNAGGATRGVRVEAFDFDPRENPFIEYQSLADMATEVDDHTFRREVLGEFVPIGDVVFYAWADGASIREVPSHFVDITERFTKEHFGRAFRHIIGADFQRTPHMAAVVLKVYVDPDNPEVPLLWVVDEMLVSDGDEDDLVDAIEAPTMGARCPCCEGRAGYVAAECVVVADASGEWQDADRTRGKGSFDWFRKRGWKAIYQPDKEMKRNPEISERVKVGNFLLRARDGRRRLFSCPHNEQTNRAMKRWEIRNGAPFRRSEFAHVCDAVTYPCWRFFPRKHVKTSRFTYEGGKRERSERESELDDIV